VHHAISEELFYQEMAKPDLDVAREPINYLVRACVMGYAYAAIYLACLLSCWLLMPIAHQLPGACTCDMAVTVFFNCMLGC